MLTGFMGTGKSTTGRIVASMLGWPFIDSDDEIVRRAGRPIPQIFAEDGEVAFRQIEREVCRDLATRENVVIATGGGMLVDDANRAAMLESGLVICLTAAPDVLASRLKGDSNRPLLKTDWRALLEKRRAAYAQIPVQLDTTTRAPREVAREIVKRWNNLNPRSSASP